MKKKYINISIILLLFIIAGMALYYFYSEKSEIIIHINNEEYSLNRSKNSVRLEGKKLFIERENIISIPNINEKYRLYINNKEVLPNKEIKMELKNLASGNYINIRLRNTVTNKEYITEISTLPNAYRGIFSTSLSPTDGFYYFTLKNTIYKMNNKGDILYYSKKDMPVLEFQPYEAHGKMYYSYLSSYEDYIFEPEIGFERNSMCVTLLDENYEEYKTISGLLPTEKAGQNAILAINGYIFIDKNHYILFGTTTKKVSNIPKHLPQIEGNNSQVAATIIQEIKDDELIFEWDSTDYPELYELGYEYNDFSNIKYQTAVYTFLNNLIIDPKDNNLYLSFKVCDAIIKIDRKTGEILSILGGKKDMYGLNDEQRFMLQHSVNLNKDGDLIIFNNGIANEARAESVTNIMKIKLDEQNKKILSFKRFDFPNKYCFNLGDAKEVDTNVFLVSWGKTVPPLSLFTEYNFNTQLINFEVQYNSRNYNYATFKFHR